MHIVKKFRFIGTIILLIGLLVYLSPVTSVRAEEKQTEQKPITVLLDWFVNPDHAPLVVALERGFFAAQGLKVELIAPADPNDPPKLVAAGQALLAISYQPKLHMQIAANLPLVRIGTIVATPLNALVTLKEGPIRTLADLAGRKIGYSVGGFEDVLLRTMLSKSGLGLQDVTLININFSLSPALLSGKVDAVIGAFRNFELNQLDLEGHKGHAFYPEEHGVPVYDELILITRRAEIQNPDLPRFLAGLEQGVHFLINHPDQAWESFLEAYPDLNNPLNRRAWRDTLTRFALRPAALDAGRYTRFAEFLQKQGLIEKIPPLSDYAIALP